MNIVAENQVCANYNNSTSTPNLVLSQCISGQFCDIPKLNLLNLSSFSTTVNCTNYSLGYWSEMSPGKLVEKDYCRNSSDCISNNCSNNTCVGLSIGQNCTYDSQCGNTAFCNKNLTVCESKVSIGNACSNNKMCPNEAGCLEGVCTLFYSLAEGTLMVNNRLGIFCQSGYSDYDGYCEGLVNYGDAPYLCDPEVNQCTYTTTITQTQVVKNTCVCDFSGSGNAYCMQATNSNQFNTYISAKRSLISSSSGCSYLQDRGCANVPTELFLNYTIASMNLYQIYNNQTMNLLPCITEQAPNFNPASCTSFPCSNEIDSLWSYSYAEKMTVVSFGFILSIILNFM